MNNDLVSVIIPAYNAAQFIDRTLLSACNQTYPRLEIIVVDDGSSDQTAEIVGEAMRKDQRIHLVRQANQGVAAARNRGILHCRGDYIAPLDADDLWHPTKIEKQMRVLRHGPQDIGLVYTLSRRIDADDYVIRSEKRYTPEGWVFLQHINQNFIGNGSSLLMRRSVVEAVGGYSTRLRELGVQGCEDFLLQLHIAAQYTFAVVPEFLVGYRRTASSMSSNHVRMALSRKLVLESCSEQRNPVAQQVVRKAICEHNLWIILSALKHGKYKTAAQACADVISTKPRKLTTLPRLVLKKFVAKRVQRRKKSMQPVHRQLFHEYQELGNAVEATSPKHRQAMLKLKILDDQLGPSREYLFSNAELGSG